MRIISLENSTDSNPIEYFPTATPPVPQTNQQPQFNIEIQNKQPEIIAPQTPIVQETLKSKKSFKKIGLLILSLFLLFSFIVFGIFTLNTFDKYSQRIETLSLLPNDPNMVITVPTNLDAPQFILLEKHLQKFPGYEIFKKTLDKEGAGKTVSQFIQDKSAKYNINFEQDLKTTLGDNAYIVITDLSPLGKELQKNTITSFNKQLQTIAEGEINSKPELNKELAQGTIPSDSPKVLGESNFVAPIEENAFKFPTLDFIAATEIKDIKKAQEIFKKMKTNDQFDLIKKSFAGFDYYQATAKTTTTDKDTFYKNIFSTIVGKNLIISSKEEDLFQAIRNGNNNRTLGFFSRTKVEKNLGENEDFKNVIANTTKGNESMLSTYVKLNFEKFFKKDNCDTNTDSSCVSATDYIKYPSDIIFSANLSINDDGIKITTFNNQQNLQGAKNNLFTEGLAGRIPAAIDGKWADIFIEHSNINDLYYTFKKNNLIDKGLEQWNNSLKEFSAMVGFNLETDFIDQIDGKSGAVLYTSATSEPAGAIIIHVKDTEKIYSTIEGIINSAIKNIADMYISSNDSLMGLKDKRYTAMIAKNKITIAALQSAKITYTETPNGKIYSFKISEPTFPIAFDFALSNNEFILGSNSSVVSGLLDASKNKNATALLNNELYLRSAKYDQLDGISKLFLVPQGIVNMINYYESPSANNNLPEENFQKNCSDSDVNCLGGSGSPDQSYPFSERIFAYGAVLKTIGFLGISQSIQDKFVKAEFFLDIKEIPLEEKTRAEKFFSTISETENNPQNSF
jgi:hypothetical protein